MSTRNYTPLALVAGGAFIGLGLYFGLAARGRAPSAERAVPSTATSETEDATPAPTANADPQRVQAAAIAALAELRPKLIEACWNPAVAERPEPATARWTWDSTFDPSGKEIARGISDVRGAERPDVAACLREQPLGMQIAPPGVIARVELELVLP